MGIDDRAADRQSHANPFGFGRVKRLEKPVELLRIEPWASVMHFGENIVRIVYAGDDRKLPRSVAGATHRFDGVDDQIDHYLLQLDPIREDERQVVREPALEPDAVALHLGVDQSDDFTDSLIDVQKFSARRHFLCERTDAADNLAG